MQIKTLHNIMLWEQTLFGLPWVAASIALAMIQAREHGDHILFAWHQLIWIVIAFISARMAGMAMNRLIDRTIDAENPRTKSRALPSQETSPFAVGLLALFSVGLFVCSCAVLNPICLALSPVALLLLFCYSYTKRFTAFCHFFLGAIHFCAPIFAWIALKGTLDYPPLCLGIAVMLSIAGSDIIYALLDVEFDRRSGIYSIPMRLGVNRAISVAKGLHVLAVCFLFLAGYTASAPFPYYLGIVFVAGLYCISYASLRPEVPQKIAHFLEGCNRRAGLGLMAATIGALVWQQLS